MAAPTLSVNTVTNVIYKYNAGFGRLNYNLKDKYVFNANVRRDGSSRFGDKNKFHSFWSVGTAWIFSSENFIQRTLPVLSFGKLRGSYGTTGSDQIGDYSFYDLYSAVRYPYQGVTPLIPSGFFNPYLAWEETKKIEGGLDLGFFKDMILLNASFYYNRSSNQLLPYILPSVTGFSSIQDNFPATVQNSGWEFSLNTTIVKSKNFNWTSSMNLTIPRNKLISFPDLSISPYQYSKVIGQPIDITKVFHFIGINDTSGVYQFSNNKGMPTTNPDFLADATIIIKKSPQFYGGIGNSFNYKAFQFEVFFQFTKQTGRNSIFQSTPPGVFGFNVNRQLLNRWQNPGDKLPFQKFTQSYISAANNAIYYLVQSDYGYTDASFIRFKNLSIAYQLPTRVIKKIRLSNCRIYAHGQNLLTITKHKGLDPENPGEITLPPLRVITFDCN